MTNCRAALYLRVSTRDQTTENQERELRQWADRLGFRVAHIYRDTVTGSRADRAGLLAALAGAHAREFDMLLIWSLDRLSREGVAKQERQRIGERVRAGQARARAQGKRLGRKPRLVDVVELRRRRAAGQGWRRIARALKAPTSTLRRKWKECQKSPQEFLRPSERSARSSEGAEGGAAG